MQIVLNKIVREVEDAVATGSGLHLSLSKKSRSTKAIEWKDVGALTFENTERIIKTHQPVLWNLINKVVARRSASGSVRSKRPPHLVQFYSMKMTV